MVALPPGGAGLQAGLASAGDAEPDSRRNVGPSAGAPHCPRGPGSQTIDTPSSLGAP